MILHKNIGNLQRDHLAQKYNLRRKNKIRKADSNFYYEFLCGTVHRINQSREFKITITKNTNFETNFILASLIHVLKSSKFTSATEEGIQMRENFAKCTS